MTIDWSEDQDFREHDGKGNGLRLARLVEDMLDPMKPLAYASSVANRVRHLADRIAAEDDRRLANEAERRNKEEQQRLERVRLTAVREAADIVLETKTVRCGGCRRNRWAVVDRAYVHTLSSTLLDAAGEPIARDGGVYTDWTRARELAKTERVVERKAHRVELVALCAACKDGETAHMRVGGVSPLSPVPEHPVGTEYTTEREWS